MQNSKHRESASLGPRAGLHLLLRNQTLDEPVWKSLFRNIDDSFSLQNSLRWVLTRSPSLCATFGASTTTKDAEPPAQPSSTCWHWPWLLLANLFGQADHCRQTESNCRIDRPGDIPDLPTSKTASGGGGGGGDRTSCKASQGRLPNSPCSSSLRPWPWCATQTRNWQWGDPTIVGSSRHHLQSPNMPDMGDPMSHLPSVASNGTGYGGGMGTGSGGGVVQLRPGYGPRSGGGTGGGVFRVAAGFPLPRRLCAGS